jgi:hypothetical protein
MASLKILPILNIVLCLGMYRARNQEARAHISLRLFIRLAERIKSNLRQGLRIDLLLFEAGRGRFDHL